MKLTPEQLRMIAADPELQKRIAEDPELERLFNERRTDKAEEDFETLMIIGSEIKIGDMSFPPPVTCLFSFLEIIDSPFVDPEYGEPSRMDIERCLFVMKHREKAVVDLAEAKRMRSAIDRIRDDAAKTPESLMVYMSFEEKNAKAWKRFDENVAEFAVELGVYKIEEAVIAIRKYLSVAGGFLMLPDVMIPEDKKKAESTIDSTVTGSPE